MAPFGPWSIAVRSASPRRSFLAVLAAFVISLLPQMANGFPIEPLPRFLVVSSEDNRSNGDVASPSALPVSDRGSVLALPAARFSGAEIIPISLPSADVQYQAALPDQTLEQLAALHPADIRTVRRHRSALRARDVDHAAEEAETSISPDDLPLRDFLRLYLNVTKDSAASEREIRIETVLLEVAPDQADQRETGRNGFLDALLSRKLNAEVAELLNEMFLPTLEPQGLVSFSIAGFGRFILLQTEGGIDIVNATTLQATRLIGTGPSLGSWRSGSAGQPGAATSGASAPLIGTLLKRVLRFLVGITHDPLSILVLMFLIAIWLVFAAGRRASQDG